MFSGWLSLPLRPLGDKVFKRSIQLSSCDSRIVVKLLFSLLLIFFSILSMIVNVASVVKSWSMERKCCSTGRSLLQSVDFIRYLQLLSLMLNGHSDFPTYCILQRMHSNKQMTFLLLQLDSWQILYVVLVTELVKELVD